MKKTNNKGFSLVELIVVVAIMAVLMVVVAPQLLRYVERTRIQRDESAASEVAHAVEIAIADEDVYSNLDFTSGDVVVTVPDNGAFTCTPTCTQLTDELGFVFPEPIDFTSAEHDTETYTITISQTPGSGATVEGEWPVAP